MGPKGRNTAIERKFSPPLILNDGVSLAKEIEFPDSFEDMGNRLVREAAEKTGDRAGDGSSCTVLLAYEITRLGMSHLDQQEENVLNTQPVNAMSLKKGISKAVEVVVEEITRRSKPLKTKEEIAQIATISSANPQTGKLIAEAMGKVGKDGLITVEEGAGIETTIQYSEGMEFEKGFASSKFVLSTDKMEAEVQAISGVEDVYILITDYRLSRDADVMDFLKMFAVDNQKKNLVVIAPIIESKALEVLVLNHQRGVINCIAIPAPGFDRRLKEVLEDIAVTIGAKVISQEAGDKLDNVTLEQLGRAEKVWADANKTRIIGGRGDRERIAQRVTQIKSEIEKTTSDWEKHKLNERIARISGGAAIIKVGAVTDIELKDIKERTIDAVEAVKAAVAEGIVAGGGITFLNVREELKKKFGENFDQGVSKDEGLGIKTVYEALHAPFEKILTNAGVNIKEIENQLELGTNKGFDVETEKMVDDMVEAGVVDPAKVLKLSLQHSSSVAMMVLTVEWVLAEKPEKKKDSSEDISSEND